MDSDTFRVSFKLSYSKPCVRQSAFTLAKEVLITDVSLVLRDKFGFFRL